MCKFQWELQFGNSAEREREREREMHRQSSRTQITIQRIGERLRERSAERQYVSLGRVTGIALVLYVDSF